jgi:hypothetical protein
MNHASIDLNHLETTVRGGTRRFLRSYFLRLRRETSRVTGNLLVADRFFTEVLSEDLDDLVERTNWPAPQIAIRAQAYLPSLAS